MHHDQGALGAASERDAVYRQVKSSKKWDVMRSVTSHNTPSSVLLEAYNELGMMVMDETFDGWAFPKTATARTSAHTSTRPSSADNKAAWCNDRRHLV